MNATRNMSANLHTTKYIGSASSSSPGKRGISNDAGPVKSVFPSSLLNSSTFLRRRTNCVSSGNPTNAGTIGPSCPVGEFVWVSYSIEMEDQRAEYSFEELAVWRTKLPKAKHALLPSYTNRPNPLIHKGRLYVSVISPATDRGKKSAAAALLQVDPQRLKYLCRKHNLQ
jgi:hypothetical protein